MKKKVLIAVAAVLFLATSAAAQPLMPFAPASSNVTTGGGGGGGGGSACEESGGVNCQMVGSIELTNDVAVLHSESRGFPVLTQNTSSPGFEKGFGWTIAGAPAAWSNGAAAFVFNDDSENVSGWTLTPASNSLDLGSTIDAWRRLFLSAGSAAGPSLIFNGDTDTGIYHISVNDIGITAAGSNNMEFASAFTWAWKPLLPWNNATLGQNVNPWSRVYGLKGLATVPPFTFGGDDDTGIYSNVADVVGVTAGGVERLAVGTSAVTSTVPIRAASGTAALPAHSFSNDPDTGVYNPVANAVGVSAAGVLRLTVDAARVEPAVQFRAIAGTAAAPSVSFSADTNTGVFSAVADTVSAATNGVERLTLNTTALTSTLPIRAASGTASTPSVSFNSSPSTGMLLASADQIGWATAGVLELALSSTNLTPTTNLGLSLGLPSSAWNQVFSGGTSSAPAFAIGSNPDSGLFSNGSTNIGIALDGVENIRVQTDQISLNQSNGSLFFNNAGNVLMSPAAPSTGSSGGFIGGSVQFAGDANTMRGTAPTAIPSCAASSSGLIVYKEDTDTAGTNSQLCLCARNNAALTYSWIPIGGSLTGTCT